MLDNLKKELRKIKYNQQLAKEDPQYKFDSYDAIISSALGICILSMVIGWVVFG